jgi:hypothetical protein
MQGHGSEAFYEGREMADVGRREAPGLVEGRTEEGVQERCEVGLQC